MNDENHEDRPIDTLVKRIRDRTARDAFFNYHGVNPTVLREVALSDSESEEDLGKRIGMSATHIRRYRRIARLYVARFNEVFA